MSKQKSKVYFTKTITPEKMIEMYNKLDIKLTGNIGVKIHSGEKGNQNFLRPEFLKPIVDYLDGTIVETNTSCPVDFGARTTEERHMKLMEEHGWTKTFKKVVILDGQLPDDELDIPNGFIMKKNYIGNKTKNYDSFLVIAHFKGRLSSIVQVKMLILIKSSTIFAQIKTLKNVWQIVPVLL